MSDWVFLKQGKALDNHVYGPITAPTAEEAIRRLAEGEGLYEDSLLQRCGLELTPYLATKRGRYHAIPLDVWQRGTFDYTKTRGSEKVAT